MRGSERTRRIPIVFVTAASHEPWRLFKGYHAGAVDFLYKPIDPVILESKASVFFELHRQRQLVAEELRQRTETLRLQEMFTAVLGHDLRNPLSAVITAAMVLQGRAADETTRDLAQRILASGRRMSRMIEDLLDLTRARLAGGIPINRTRTDLAPVVERVVQELSEAHPSRALTLAIEGDVAGEWDVDRLQQVLSNLVGNAIQHGDPGAAIAISLEGRSPAAVCVSVANGGVIAPALLPTIFDPFQSGRRDRAEGLGLGLYIARQIAIAHGGSLDVTSTPESGTAFLLRLPRRSNELVRL
jgi:signal transduction histidine kinase